MPPIDRFTPILPDTYRIRPDLIAGLLRECVPRILVVTDGLSFQAGDGFGLTEFVAALRATTIHGMTPIVTTAFHGSDPSSGADLPTFDFATGLQQPYDVLFIMGIGSAAKPAPGAAGGLAPAEVAAITAFMDAGKGVFATGDHDALGAALCGELPRIRDMRRWYVEDGAPSAHLPTRITTVSPGADGVFAFDDQSDDEPQKIYPRYYQPAPGVSAPHPILQAPTATPGATYWPIELAPDHPHEGEVVEPAVAGLAGWPAGSPAPEIIAYGVTYGGAFPGKDAVRSPRTFGVVGAWDGHAVTKGRVVVESTWHHYVNINLDGTGTTRAALKPGGAPSPAYQLLTAYWHNLASWLMPARVRRCLRIAKLADVLVRFPLREEIGPVPWPPPGPDPLPDLGRRVIAELARTHTPAELAEALADLRALALGHEVPTATAWIDESVVGALVAWTLADGHATPALAKRLGDPHTLAKRLPPQLGATIKASVSHQRNRLAALAKDRDALAARVVPQ
ncbi:MAG: hypothetical protein R3B06_29600 [Kofleriaceae bacterium]